MVTQTKVRSSLHDTDTQGTWKGEEHSMCTQCLTGEPALQSISVQSSLLSKEGTWSPVKGWFLYQQLFLPLLAPQWVRSGDTAFPDGYFLGCIKELCSHGCQISSGVNSFQIAVYCTWAFPHPHEVFPNINCVSRLSSQDRPSASLSDLHPPPGLVWCRTCLCARFLCVHGLQVCHGCFGVRNSHY